MASLSIYRTIGQDKGPLYAIFEIYLDNQLVGEIQIQETFTMEITDGEHTLCCKDVSMNAFSNAIKFTATAQSFSAFTIHPFNDNLSALFALLLIGGSIWLGSFFNFNFSIETALTLGIILPILYFKTIGKRNYLKLRERKTK